VTRCYVNSVVQAHEAEPRRRLWVSVMPSQADTEASLLKPATRTGILAIFGACGEVFLAMLRLPDRAAAKARFRGARSQRERVERLVREVAARSPKVRTQSSTPLARTIVGCDVGGPPSVAISTSWGKGRISDARLDVRQRRRLSRRGAVAEVDHAAAETAFVHQLEL
jgi:hypothetical protein